MKVWSGFISPNAKRVRICAAELGVPVEHRLVDFQKGENRSADYLAMNPMGKAPTITDDDFVLWESGAILYYLAQKHGGAIWPKDARGQADAMRWLFFTSCHVDPYLTTLVVERVLKARRQEPPDEAMVRGAEGFLARFIPVIEQQLAAREYLTGKFGLADVALGCSMELSAMLKVDLGPYPNVRAWLDRLHARPTWGGAGPEAFPPTKN